MIRDIEIGWIAGFLDGDGCFGWYGENQKRNNSRKQWLGYPMVTAAQNELEPLERINKKFPGVTRYILTQTNGKERFEYRAINSGAIDIMVAVFPLMSSRRQEKIKEVIANYANRESERVQDALFCPKGHSREKYGFRVKSGANKGDRRCKECNKEWATIAKINKEKALA